MKLVRLIGLVSNILRLNFNGIGSGFLLPRDGVSNILRLNFN